MEATGLADTTNKAEDANTSSLCSGTYLHHTVVAPFTIGYLFLQHVRLPELEIACIAATRGGIC